MTVRDTSLEALAQNKPRLAAAEQKVYELLLEIGPAHDRRIMEALNQKEQKTLKPRSQRIKWEINSVTGRRNALVMMGHVIDMGKYTGFWHKVKKTYHWWKVKHDSRRPIGWVKVEDKKAKLEINYEHVKVRGRKQTTATRQMVFV